MDGPQGIRSPRAYSTYLYGVSMEAPAPCGLWILPNYLSFVAMAEG